MQYAQLYLPRIIPPVKQNLFLTWILEVVPTSFSKGFTKIVSMAQKMSLMCESSEKVEIPLQTGISCCGCFLDPFLFPSSAEVCLLSSLLTHNDENFLKANGTLQYLELGRTIPSCSLQPMNEKKYCKDWIIDLQFPNSGDQPLPRMDRHRDRTTCPLD